MSDKQKIINDLNFVIGTLNGICFFPGTTNMFDAIDSAKEQLLTLLENIINEFEKER